MKSVTDHYRAPLKALATGLTAAGIPDCSEKQLRAAFPGLNDDVRVRSEALVLQLDAGALKPTTMHWGMQERGSYNTTIAAGAQLNGRWRAFCAPEFRCVVPATMIAVFNPASQEPHWFRAADDGVFGFAGVWRTDEVGDERGVALMPGFPSESIAPLGLNVFPRVIEPSRWLDWLTLPTNKAAYEFGRRPLDDFLKLVPTPEAMRQVE